MEGLRLELAKLIDRACPEDGYHATQIPGVYCIKISHANRRAKQRWQASFSIVAEGEKEILLERKIYRCAGAHYIATPLDLPVISRISNTIPEKPFLALKIDFDALTLSEVASQIEKTSLPEIETPLRAMFISKTTLPMLEAAVRLARLFQMPHDAPVLGPLIIKELFYHLLVGEDGVAIRQFVRSGSKMHKISQSIFSLRSQLREEIDVETLAKAASMSRSAFFKHFKEVTAMSPIQYQKRLRLLEARRLMIDEGESAEGSAYKVGYNSASQFSREYSRMFGASPLRDVAKTRKTGAAAEQNK